MSAASTRWLRSALRVSDAPTLFRGLTPRPRLSIYQNAPGWLHVTTPRYRRPYSVSTPEQSLEGQLAEGEEKPLSAESEALAESLKHPVGGPTESEPPSAEQYPEQPLAQDSETPSPSLENLDIDLIDPVENTVEEPAKDPPNSPPRRKLPLQCPGCGAFSQTTEKTIPGFYDTGRRVVREYINPPKPRGTGSRIREENNVVRELLKTLSPKEIEDLGFGSGMIAQETPEVTSPTLKAKPPLCDRCHDIVHHHKGASIYHPTVASLRHTISESPHNDNHIYHVLDAADFPMSVVPRLNEVLGGFALRTRNRRSRPDRFLHGQKVEMSFVITRSDLLAPQKEQVDRLLPYLRETLREALGKTGKDIRLGNVYLVSAKRSWWTRDLKERIWDKGGAAWMVGKVNVGKSQLFEAIFPKGKVGERPSKSRVEVDLYKREGMDEQGGLETKPTTAAEEEEDDVDIDEIDFESLLPPLRKLTNYPEMPTVSALPGTTASPIRIPFGNNKGELIDLPGLARGDLELFVKEEHRSELVMKSRLVPKQHSIKPGQSLLLGGGLVRITPKTDNITFLAYAFTPIGPHVTSSEKAEGLQAQTVPTSIEQIMTKEGAETVRSAGKFLLKDDVTKSRSGPITRNDFLAMKVQNLPWRVLATDILIEGVGWVEIVAQVRAKAFFAKKAEEEPSPEPLEKGKKDPNDPWVRLSGGEIPEEEPSQPDEALPEEEEAQPNWPEIEVFTPEGRFVGQRRCMNGWLLNKPLVLDKHKRARPRRSMKGHKKQERERSRAMLAEARASVRAAA